MEEPIFPFYSEGDESGVEHCADCGKPLPDEGDPGVIYVNERDENGNVISLPVCRLHWHERVGWWPS